MGHPSGVRLATSPSLAPRLAAAGLLLALLLPVLPAGAEEAANGALIGRIAAEDVLLRSGAGATISLPTELLLALAGDEDRALWAMPSESALIEALYSSATGGDRWQSAAYNNSISEAGQATATLAGLRLVGLLQNIGGKESARARLYAVAAKAQADYALVNLVGADTDTMTATDAWLLLHAISEMAHATSPDGPAPVRDELFHAWFVEGAHELHRIGSETPLSDLAAASIAARALLAYTQVAEEPAQIAGQIESLTTAAGDPHGPVDTSRAIRLHLAASQATGNGEYATRAGGLLGELLAALDSTTRAIEGTKTLTIWELADVIGALGDAYAAGLADTRQVIDEIVRHLVIDSGLMPAAPTADNTYYPHLDASGLTFSDERIWTFASEIGYDATTGWKVTNPSIDLPGALYAAGELMTLPDLEPTVELTPEPSRARTVTVQATEFAFNPDTISLVDGETVTLRLVNNGVIEHNIDLPSLGVLVTAGPGETADIAFVVPGPDQSGDFFCSLPGHTESGMIGTISIDVASQPLDDTAVVQALPQLDEAGGSPTIEAAILIALGFFLGMMVLVVGMLQFMKGFEDEL